VSDTGTGKIPEPDWLAAEPTARAKLTAIFAAVRRYYAASRTPSERGQPCLGLTTAELFIGQMMTKASAGHGHIAGGEHLPLFSAAAAIDRMLMTSPCYGEHHQDSDVELARVALDAATPFIAASERERTCQMAETRHATYQDHNGDSQPFADLLRETP
jgi:hypothetical protein